MDDEINYKAKFASYPLGVTMKNFIQIGSFLLIFLLSNSYAESITKNLPVHNQLFQVATINALAAGGYDGDFEYKDLFSKGTLGLGTFNALDGEMVAVDGKFYQIDGKGHLNPVSPTQLTPFAEVVNFKATIRGQLDNVKNLSQISQLEQFFTKKNTPYAIRIDGQFKKLKLRSVPAQKQPYPSLADVSSHQAIFYLDNMEGTLVGFWFPQYWSGIGVPGFHLHFVDKQRQTGGHVLDLDAENITYQIAPIENITLYFPKTQFFSETDLTPEKWRADVEKSEKGVR